MESCTNILQFVLLCVGLLGGLATVLSQCPVGLHGRIYFIFTEGVDLDPERTKLHEQRWRGVQLTDSLWPSFGHVLNIT